MSTHSFAHRRRSLLRVLLCVLLAAACDSAPPPTSPSPSSSPLPSPPPPPIPAPTPRTPQYLVSGIVTDAADAAPIAGATVVLQHYQGHLTTRTGADGAYAFSFDTSQPYRHRLVTVPGDFLALLSVKPDNRRHWPTVQLLPWGTSEVVQNVRLRPVRTLAAGQSMGLSVESDSSFAWWDEYDPWEFPYFGTLKEEFLVSVPTDGLLTIDARPLGGSNVATLTCQYVGCPAFLVQGTISIRVQARYSPLYFSVEIPRASAPQRYEIQTSLK